MKTYWEIQGPSKAPRQPCIAFHKYDGSNLRFEWTKKQGWWKFGTRHRLFDHTDTEFGEAIQTFQQTLSEGILEVLWDNKQYRGVTKAIVYCEFVGSNSFAGLHDFTEPHELVLFDVNVHKKGFVLPKDFVDHFGHLRTAEVVYQGNFNDQFIQDVIQGKYPVGEGVVAKGVKPGKGVHGLWMAKVKTRAWFERIKERAEYSETLKKVLADNLREQELPQ